MKTRGKFYSLFISLVLLMGMVAGSVSAAGSSTGYTGELPDPYNGEQPELSEEQLEMVELSKKHFKGITDSEGNIKLEIVNIEEYEQKAKELGHPMNMRDIQNIVDNFNAYLNPTSKSTLDVPSGVGIDKFTVGGGGDVGTNNFTVGGGGGVPPIDSSGFSCSDALTIIGFIHAGSYTYAAYLLGITSGSSILIPALTGAAYGLASILCD